MTFIMTIPIVVIFSRLIIQSIESNFLRHINQENVLVFGAGKVGNAFVSAVSKLTASPLNIIGFIDDRKDYKNSNINFKPVLGGLNDLESIILKYNIDHIIVAIKEPSKEKTLF